MNDNFDRRSLVAFGSVREPNSKLKSYLPPSGSVFKRRGGLKFALNRLLNWRQTMRVIDFILQRIIVFVF